MEVPLNPLEKAIKSVKELVTPSTFVKQLDAILAAGGLFGSLALMVIVAC
jgi:hypothetical protein